MNKNSTLVRPKESILLLNALSLTVMATLLAYSGSFKQMDIDFGLNIKDKELKKKIEKTSISNIDAAIKCNIIMDNIPVEKTFKNFCFYLDHKFSYKEIYQAMFLSVQKPDDICLRPYSLQQLETNQVKFVIHDSIPDMNYKYESSDNWKLWKDLPMINILSLMSQEEFNEGMKEALPKIKSYYS